MKFVPVIDQNQNPLMPTSSWRAARWIKSRKATPFWKGHVFCVRLNQEPSDNKKQDIAVGIDPGSKKEGFTVKGRSHTYLNVQTDAITHVKDAVETRRMMRNNRRQRKTPCRQPRHNRSCLRKSRMPPSTKARWQWKLSILNWLKKLFPVSHVIVEDIKARTIRSAKKWNFSFSPLEVGKKWFYSQIENLSLKEGWQTKELRDKLVLKKLENKISNDWSAHCVDSWVIANSVVGGDAIDNKEVMCVSKIRLHRRQLYYLQLSKNGKKKPYGGTISLGFKSGCMVVHKKYGLTYVGGKSKGRISLHSINSGTRLSQKIKTKDCVFVAYNGRRAFVSQS